MTMYNASKYYIETYGWVLVPIPPGTKAPTQPGWNIRENCITTIENCDFFKDHQNWNVGALLSESGLVALDIDNVINTTIIFNTLGIDYKKIIKGAPRISGRQNHDKILFKAPPILLARKSISWPTEEDPTKTEVVFEFRAGAIQDVLPPSFHPDTKVPYEWKNVPEETIPEFPKELLTIWKQWDKFKRELVDACPWIEKKSAPLPPKKTRMLGKASDDVIGAFNSHHDVEDLLTRYGYKKTAGGRYLSPYSTTGLAGVVVFKNENRIFSHHASDPFDTSHSLDAFDLYCHFDHGGDVTSAVRAASESTNLRKIVQYDPELIEHGRAVFESWTKRNGETTVSIPERLLSIPGILQDVVEYYNTTAPKQQPQFAVQAALALGSTVMGRRWKTDQFNYPSLYYLNVGKSSTGKEHAKRVIENLLLESGLDFLIGPSGYTSSGGVLTALIERPCHISIIDELGRLLESINHAANSNKVDAQTTLMETFGRLDGIIRAQGYSSMTLTKSQREDEGVKQVHCPALTILAMTTPSTLYSAISTNSVKSGFVPRFIIVESDIGRQLSRQIKETLPSSRLLAWMKKSAAARTANGGNLSDDFGPHNPPSPVIVPFEPGCWSILHKYDKELLDRMNEADKFGLDEMYGKSKEIAQRVSLIVAVSCESDTIKPEHVNWAIDYVRFYNNQTVSRLKSIMSDSQFEAACKEVLEIIVKNGIKGATIREISRGSKLYRGMDPKQRKGLFEVLHTDHGVELVSVEQHKAGRPRQAYVSSMDDTEN